MASTLNQLLELPDSKAVAVRLREGDWTYGELRGRVTDMAQSLLAAGVGAGSRTIIQVDDLPTSLLAILATMKVGAIAVPINPAFQSEDLSYVVENADPAAVVAEEGLIDAFDNGQASGLLVASRDGLTVKRRCAVRTEPRDPAGQDTAGILYTSGSSARPKGVVLSHHAHLTMGRDFSTALGTGKGDAYLLCAPLFHVSGWSTVVLPALFSGSPVIIPGKFSASRFWEDVERWKPTIWPTGLGFLEMIGAGGGEPPETNSFRYVFSNLRDDTWELASQKLRLPIGPYFALTESNGRGATAPRLERYEPGLVGTPLTAADRFRISHEGEVLGPGEVGEIELHGVSSMSGYFRDPEATAQALRPDGWLRTGDLGMLDEDGRLFYRGRLKNIIRRSGENVSAEEVETLLLSHPDVLDAIVIGVPDRIREEEVKALVVKKPDSQLSAAEVHEFCVNRIARFKAPRFIEFKPELPRTISGKQDVGTVRRTMSGIDTSWDMQSALSP